MGNEDWLDVVRTGRTVVVVDVSDGSTSTTVDSDSDEGIVEKGIGGDAFDGCIVGVTTSMTLMWSLVWTTRWTLTSAETTAGSERVTL